MVKIYAALGVIQKWYKQEGDVIKRDEVICDIRTEVCKAKMLTALFFFMATICDMAQNHFLALHLWHAHG